MTSVNFHIDEWFRKAIPSINKGLTAAAEVMHNHAVEILNGPSPSAPGSPPGHDTGYLIDSISFISPEVNGKPLQAAFGTAVMYGRYLEFGATITPKKSKYLAVPVNRALAQTMMRKMGPQVSGLFGTFHPESIRNIPGLKYIPPGKGKTHGGRLVLASSVKVHNRKTGKSPTASAGTTVFVLKKSVTVAARPWLWRSALESRDQAMSVAQRVTLEGLRGAGLVKRG